VVAALTTPDQAEQEIRVKPTKVVIKYPNGDKTIVATDKNGKSSTTSFARIRPDGKRERDGR
jgi:hypothetical protein